MKWQKPKKKQGKIGRDRERESANEEQKRFDEEKMQTTFINNEEKLYG